MASSQGERIEEIAVQFSFKETETLGEIMKQAECSLESQQLTNECHAVVAQNDGLTQPKFPGRQFAGLKVTAVGGVLSNQGKKGKNFMVSKKYSGHIVKDFPGTLGTGVFAMSAMTDKGVKAAVVYSGMNETGIECGWLLAFADTKATGRRVSSQSSTISTIPKSFPHVLFSRKQASSTQVKRKSEWTAT